MKARLFRLAITAAALVSIVAALGADRKWL